MEGSGAEIPMDCLSCHVLAHSEWDVLSKAEARLLDRGKTCSAYAPGETLFREGDPCRGVYCVHDGLVGVRKTDQNGQSVLLARFGYPGSMLGYRPFLAGECHRGTAEALAPSRVCFIGRDTVEELLARNPRVGLNFLHSMTKALGEAEEGYFQVATHSLRRQLVHLLLIFRSRFGVVGTDGAVRLQLPLSRQDMAAMIGVRPESLSRTIRELNDEGLVRFSGRTAHLLDIQALSDELDE